ncbi:MAG: TonB-dependent receptor, partial [Bacteroidota bacterium]
NISHLFLYQRKMLVLLFLSFLGTGLYAQFKVTGQVTSEGEPLIGVNILVDGSSGVGTATDFDGNYELDLKDGNQTLVFSYTGFLDQKISVNGQSTLNVVMAENATQLDEVVVVGYGAVSKRDLTGSVSSIKGEELTKVQSISFEQGLAARAAGVQVVASEGGPGASMKVRVRGGTSINASSDPLYVIDGFPIFGSSQSTNVGLGNSSTSPLASIDPSDIESIEVLKDASATAIYGARGANGVVLITTKSGKKGRAKTSLDVFFGVSEIARNIDLLNPQEYVDFWHEFFPWDPNDPTNQYTTQYRDNLGNEVQLDDPRLIITDWRDKVLRRANLKNYKVSVSGGTDKTTYSGSFGFIDQQGIINTSFFERYSGNLKINQKITDKLSGGININIGFSQRGGVISASTESRNGRNGLLTNVSLFSPVQGLRRRGEAEYDENGILLSDRDGDIVNPEKLVNETLNTNNEFNSFGGAFLSFEPIEGLALRTSFSGNLYAYRGKAWYPGDFGWGQATNGRAIIGSNQRLGWLNENTISFKKDFGIHRFNVVGGFTQQGSTSESLRTETIDFAIPGINLDNLAAGAEVLPSRSNRNEWGLVSYLGRVNYTLDEKYLFTVTARYDGSSRFSERARWGLFPSAAIGWRIGEEDLIKDIDAISSMKLRASYGQSGNQEIGLYRSLASYVLANYITDDTRQPGLGPDRLANPDLTWETTSQLDVGLELGLFKDRVFLNLDYYNKQTEDLLLEVPVPFTSGFTFAFKNLGKVENKGWEFSLNTQNIVRNGFNWSTSFNISFNRNKILDLGDAESFTVSSIGEHRNDYIIQVGQPLGSFYGFEVDGLYNYEDFKEFEGLSVEESAAIMEDFSRNDEEWFTLNDGVQTRAGVSKYRPGVIKFKDLNGDGVVDANDRTILGNSQPDYFGGLTNNFSYKGFDLSVFTSFSVGNEVYNNNKARGYSTAIPFFNKFGPVRDRWTPTNPDTEIWSIWGTGDGGSGDDSNSFFIEDGSFLRLANITFGYTIPKVRLEKLGMSTLRVYASVDNLYVWTNYTGFDPDVSVGFNQLTPGLDFDSYPRMRTYRVGVNVGF